MSPLLARTTRSVSLTDAGERLFQSVGAPLDQIAREVTALSALRDKPAGTVRITTVEHAAESILWPAMAKFLSKYPDINIEIHSDYGLSDIAKDRYDAEVRLGEQVDTLAEKRNGRSVEQTIETVTAAFGEQRVGGEPVSARCLPSSPGSRSKKSGAVS